MSEFPKEIPTFLKHSENDAPVPTWSQLTRSNTSINFEMVTSVSRILTGEADSSAAFEMWESWNGSIRRSTALLVDKIYHEGWLEFVGRVEGWPWDGGFFFWPRSERGKTLSEILNDKSRAEGVYTRCSLSHGVAGYLSAWNHRAWQRSWIENDCPFGSLHVGIFSNGCAEVHLDVFNPVFTNGAKPSEVLSLPVIGRYNRRLFRLHKKWEGSKYGPFTRTSANLYHLMRDHVPLCF